MNQVYSILTELHDYENPRKDDALMGPWGKCIDSRKWNPMKRTSGYNRVHDEGKQQYA